MPRRGENIYKRKDGRWEGRYKKHISDKKTRYCSVYGKTYTEVRQKLLLAKTSPDIEESNNVLLFKECAEKWLDDIKQQIKQSTFVKYTNIVNNHLITYFDKYRINELTTECLKKFVSLKLESGSVIGNNPLSAKTMKDILSVVKLILKYGESMGVSTKCDFSQIIVKTSPKTEISISKKNQDKLTEYLLHNIDYTKLGILLCLYTGIRIGELCALKFEDVCIDDNTIKITKTMQRLQNFSSESESKTSIVISSPKSVCSQREIPIPKFLSTIIQTFQFKPETYILTGKNNKYVEPRTLEYRFKKCLKECGIEDYRFHQLRHRFATHCVEIGFDIKCLSEILGHSNVNITLNRYVHSSFELKKENMDKLQVNCIY